eukprot:TRINITY_DN2329_c0_g2_i2.p2 TRINITY_DN2329_c0_g2~~TRINITY_DN2329_c0_g2_i2.p2  ORF type:complete len:308 (-),score=20.62 TRINITY_DN2329_c0_g2_i2:880-1731(-)
MYSSRRLVACFLQGINHTNINQNLAVKTTQQLWPPNLYIRYYNIQSSQTQQTVDVARDLLESLNVQNLRKELVKLGQQQLVINKTEITKICRQKLPTSDDRDIEEIIRALHKTGTVLVFQDVVFLRPEEVANSIVESLPDTEEEVRSKLQSLEQEIIPLEKRKLQMERSAEFWTQFFIWGGFLLLSAQFGIFIYYTYYTYSWDVMEPITYFVGQIFMLLGYLYFLTTKEDFAFQNFQHMLKQFFWGSKVKQLKFDQERYNQLSQEIVRWSGLLRKLKMKTKIT